MLIICAPVVRNRSQYLYSKGPFLGSECAQKCGDVQGVLKLAKGRDCSMIEVAKYAGKQSILQPALSHLGGVDNPGTQNKKLWETGRGGKS